MARVMVTRFVSRTMIHQISICQGIYSTPLLSQLREVYLSLAQVPRNSRLIIMPKAVHKAVCEIH